FFAAGHAHADESQAGPFQFLETSHRVAEVGVAGVDYDIIGLQFAAKRCDLLIHRGSSRHYDNDRARRADGLRQFIKVAAWHNTLGKLTRARPELLHPRDRAVEHRDGVALFGNVERKVRAHRAKADQTDFRFVHRRVPQSGVALAARNMMTRGW